MKTRPFLTCVAAFAALLWASAAEASCIQPPPLDQAIAQADVVFVGTVQDIDHGGLTATFHVEEMWKGTVGETVVVHGGPGIAALEDAARKGQGVATSVDRTYTAGTRYLVLPHGKADGVLLDNICSSTQPYTDELDSYRPSAAQPPGGGEPVRETSPVNDGGRGPLAWALVALLAALGAGLAIVIARSRLKAHRAA